MIVRANSTLPPDETYGLTPDRYYRVLEIEADMYRLMSDDDHPVLYDPEHFTVVDSTIPPDWISEVGDDGELYADAASNPRYAWEAYHDGNLEAIRIVNEYLSRLGPLRWN